MNTVDALIVDLLEHVAGKERSYAEVIDAWHTSCPDLPIWEEANERGLVTRARQRARRRQDHNGWNAFVERYRRSALH